jgi:murein DD-endopeptidase MepM/ murein hydrolase activator NlpD
MVDPAAKIGIVLVSLLLLACGRSGGPAPVDYRSGGQTATSSIEQQTLPAPTTKPAQITQKSLPPPITTQPVATPSTDVRTVAPAPNGGHIVVAGETVYAVARTYGVPIRAIIEDNELAAPYRLKVGQRLRVPKPEYHQVRSGETIFSIAQQYDLGLNQLVRENDLQSPYVIKSGEKLRLPKTEEITVASTVSTKTAQTSQGVVPLPATKPSRDRDGPAPVYGESSSASAPPRTGRRFSWPVQGKVISRFGGKTGGRYNDGINIRAHNGTAIRAAENGVVAYSGNELAGFGNLLLIRHDGGWMTAYAHNQENFVAPGERVKRGQLVARVGSTGSVDDAQLHFEVRKGKRAVDPLDYLAGESLKLSALVD